MENVRYDMRGIVREIGRIKSGLELWNRPASETPEERVLRLEEIETYGDSLLILNEDVDNPAREIEELLLRANGGKFPRIYQLDSHRGKVYAYVMTLSILYKHFPEFISQTSPRDLYDRDRRI